MKSQLADEAAWFASRTRLPTPPCSRRLLTRLRSASLDRRLADGANPLASPLLALRAQQLVAPGTRDALARSIETMVRLTEEHGWAAGLGGKEPRGGHAVQAARDDLLRLAERLHDEDPVSERGVALTAVLLRDGTGPMYNRRASLPLHYCARIALQCLDL